MSEALLGVVFENLVSLTQNELSTISGIKEKAEKISSTLDLIKAVLEDAEEKQVTDHSIKVWLQQLKDVVYVLDDILDECSIESHCLGGLLSFKPNNIMFRHRLGNRLEEITRRLDQIAERKNKFLLRKGVKESLREVVEWRETGSIINQPQIYGRDDDKEKTVDFLLNQARCSDFLSIYPIVGLGGLGKTTLVQMAYNDERVSNNFDINIWVCVSENFSIKRILCSIIESIIREKYDAFNLDVIERKVQELLQSKRYLIVLDDVWKTSQDLELGLSQDKWSKLKCVLSCGSKGSSILVSTRDKDVAAIMGTCQAHHLDGLSEDQCWLLFQQYAFGSDKENCPELVTIGKEIVQKCGGSPLAAQALGALLHSRNEEKEWIEVKESRLWTLTNENSIFAALRLSYFHLTRTSKQCFAFCAIFPKDAEIMKEELIHLWLANGFISSRKNLEVEDVGNMIWNELYQKSFFQDIKVNDEGDTLFKMHDLVHDLAQSVMGHECMIVENSNVNELSKSTHYINFVLDKSSSFNKGAFEKIESLRTLYQTRVCGTIISCCFPTNCSLRVLRAGSFKLSSLANLIHLRYLELCDLKIKNLPDSICSLKKLEVLKLTNLVKLYSLPKYLTHLQNLRHLVIKHCQSLSHMCPNIRKLSCLKTLNIYIVSSKNGHSLVELHDLNLAGNLSIECLENVSSLSEVQEADLKGKKDLRMLGLEWNKWGSTKSQADPEQVLNLLQPHSNLRTLRINGYEGLKFPSWFGMLRSLVDLKLTSCNKCVQLPPLGNLPSLKILEIWYMDDVKFMDDEESCYGTEVKAFPSLEKLKLMWLQKLERLLKVERGEMFPRLSDLTISNCPKLMLPPIPSLKRLKLDGCSDKCMRSVSSFNGLIYLLLASNSFEEGLTSFPEEMLRNLTCLQTLEITNCPRLKELPNELFNLNALEHLHFTHCGQLESLPEQGWEGLRSLRILKFKECRGLRSFPEGVRHLTSLEYLRIEECPALKKRCKEGTGEDWDKIAHVPRVEIVGGTF